MKVYDIKKTRRLVGKHYQDSYSNREAYVSLIVAKQILLKEFPFWGVLAVNLKLIEDSDHSFPELTTLMTDGYNIIYNADFINRLTREEIVFVVAHEIMHNLYNHCDPDRAGARDRDILNYAQDYVINGELVQTFASIAQRKGTPVGKMPAVAVHDEKYYNMYTEKVYELLIQDMPPMSGGRLDIHVVITDAQGGEESTEFDENSNTLTIRINPEADSTDGKDGEGKDDGSETIRVSINEDLAKKWKSALSAAAAAQHSHDQDQGGAGLIPFGAQRFIEQLIEPVIDWRVALARYMRMVVQRGYSMKRPNKKLFDQGFTLPGFRNTAPVIEADIAVDTSGSIGIDELTEFVSELKGILSTFKKYKIRIWCFDGDVIQESYAELDSASGLVVNNIAKFAKVVKGGGGTSFSCNWEFMKARKFVPNVFLMFTDGYPFGEWGDSRYCPTIFLINNNKITAPFGKTIHYERKN